MIDDKMMKAFADHCAATDPLLVGDPSTPAMDFAALGLKKGSTYYATLKRPMPPCRVVSIEASLLKIAC